MVGPSSSHTAGACKLGQIARALFHGTPEKATFVLHGSFANVYKGHATDRALVAGVMRFKSSDSKIKDAFKIAPLKDLKYEFKTANLGKEYHPNTVKIILEKKGRKPMAMIGSSIGGGVVQVVKIDQFNVDIHGVAGYYKTLIVWHDKKPGVLENLCKQLNKFRMKIQEIQKIEVGNQSLAIINMPVNKEGTNIKLHEILSLEYLPGIHHARLLTTPEE